MDFKPVSLILRGTCIMKTAKQEMKDAVSSVNENTMDEIDVLSSEEEWNENQKHKREEQQISI
eukprot:m.230646 g.230646  ORF g.230646 m.230646 type:complete len:63 (+) comp13892_c1_seq3:3753-3941(+)